jgi:hypothetical protein
MLDIVAEKGKRVTVKCSNGELRENIVWECTDKLVYVCSERQYQALQSGQDAPPPIGFLTNDIVESSLS